MCSCKFILQCIYIFLFRSADLLQNAMIGPYARTGQKYVWRDAADFVLVSMMYARSAKIQAVNSNAGTNSRKSMVG